MYLVMVKHKLNKLAGINPGGNCAVAVEFKRRVFSVIERIFFMVRTE